MQIITLLCCSLSEIKLRDLELKPEALDGLNLPSVNVKHGRVGTLTLTIPGGAIAWLVNKQSPITVTISDLYILVDKKISAPGEIAQQLMSAKAAALDLDAAMYRQQVADWVQQALTGSSASGPTSGVPKGIVESALLKLRVSVSNVHVRYEDRTSLASSPFAVGVTLDALSLGTDEPRAGDPTRTRHGVELSSLAVYWDPLVSTSRGLSTQGAGASSAHDSSHCFIVEPLSMDLKVLRSNSARAAVTVGDDHSPALAATLTLPAVHLCISRMQALQGAYLGKWVSDQSAVQLREELKRCEKWTRRDVRVGEAFMS